MAKSKLKTKKMLEEEEAPVKSQAEESDADALEADAGEATEDYKPDEAEQQEEDAADEPEDAADDADEAAKTEADDGEEAADEEDAGEEEEAAADESAGDDEEGGADQSLDTTPRAPTPKITKTAMLLILLNWAAAPAFLTFAYMDHLAHVQHSYRTLFNHVAIWGLPLRSEEDFPSLSNETRPQYRLTTDQLSKAFKSRAPGFSVSAAEPFEPVEEPVPLRLRPSDMSKALLSEMFSGQSDGEVETLEEEIERLKGSIPALIKRAADKVLEKQKSDDEKRAVVQKVLLTMAGDVRTIKKLDKELTEASGAALDTLVLESVQRRLYFDILAPLNIFRPGELFIPKKEGEDLDVSKFKIEKMAELKAAEIKGMLLKRLDASIADRYDAEVHLGEPWRKEASQDGMQRDSVEKRQKIAFILFTLSQVEVPTLGERLVPKGIERAQTVCGFYEFTTASIHYVRALDTLQKRIADSVIADRQGYLAMVKGAATRTDGFIDDYEREVDRLLKSVEEIDLAQKRIADLKTQHAQAMETNKERFQQHANALKRLLSERQSTEKHVLLLRAKQQQLHQALVELSDAAARNFRLHDEIQAIEMRYIQEAARAEAAAKKKGKVQP